MTAAVYHKKLARVLDRMGGLYSLNDILSAIADGRMQSFVEGDSWAITRIAVHPRARTLDVVAAIGDLDDCRVLHDRILQYARDNDIRLVQAYGRPGWMPDAAERGWKVKTQGYVYQKDL